MRRLTKILLTFFAAAFILNGCYDEYRFDYDYSAVYFAIQYPTRTVVIEDGTTPEIEIGVTLAGKYVNEIVEEVYFNIAPELLSDFPDLTLLPENYYELSNESQIEIPAGRFLGTINLTLNDNFLNDENASQLHYALPIKIESASTDSILGGKDETIIAIKFQNKYYGSYWVKGVDYTLDNSNAKVETYTYSEKDLTTNNYTVFGTSTKDVSIIPYVGLDITGNNSMQLNISGDGNVTISSGVETDISSISGTGKYDSTTKEFYLDYTYMKDGAKHEVHDTLIYFATPMELETWN